MRGGQKKEGKKRSANEEKKKKSDRKKNWDLAGIEHKPGLKSSLGPLTLRSNGCYAYNSEGVMTITLKGPGENTELY